MITWEQVIAEIKATLIRSGEYTEHDLRGLEYSFCPENGEDGDAPDENTIVTRFNLAEYFKTESGYSVGELRDYMRPVADEDGDVIDYESIGYDLDFWWHPCRPTD